MKVISEIDFIKERIESGKRLFLLFSTEEKELSLGFYLAVEAMYEHFKDEKGLIIGEKELAFSYLSGNMLKEKEDEDLKDLLGYYYKYHFVSIDNLINYEFDKIDDINRRLILNHELKKSDKEKEKDASINEVIPYKYIGLESIGISVHPKKIVDRVIKLYNLASGGDVTVFLKSVDPVVYQTLLYILKNNKKEAEKVISIIELPTREEFLTASVEHRLKYIINNLTKKYWEEEDY